MKRAALAAIALCGCGAEPAPDAHFHDEGPSAAPLVRPDTPGNNLQFNFEASEVVESFASPGGSFRVHFTRMGTNAVPAADADTSGVPDFVEEVATVYDDVLDFYANTLGFRAPLDDAGIGDNGGDARFDVYLVNFGGVGDGHYSNDGCEPQNPQICAGYMSQENDYAGYGYPSTLVANQILGSHEFFHAIQAAYDIEQGSIMAEGTAVWATEQYDSSLSDFEAFIDGFLGNPDRSLDVPLPGPVDPFSYGSAIFFQFLEERFGDGTVRALWERCENGANGSEDPLWFTELDATIAGQEAGASFADAYVEFATWNLFTGGNADPARSYADGAGYAAVTMSDVALPFVIDKMRVFYSSAQYHRAPPGDRTEVTAALVDDGGGIDGASLLLVARQAAGFDPVLVVADPTAGTETVNTAGASQVVAIVVNSSQSGDSLRPALCFGSVEEVTACREAHAIGEGGGGAGGEGGAGEPSDEDVVDDGCGCRTAGSQSSSNLGALALLLGLLWAQRRLRRTQSNASR